MSIADIGPAMVIVSQQCGDFLVQRLCDAVENDADVGYMAIVLLIENEPARWEGGPVPLPVPIEEPLDVQRSNIGQIVEKLLGLSA